MAIPAHSGDDDAWRGEEFRPAGEFWPHTILPLQYFPPLAPQPEGSTQLIGHPRLFKGYALLLGCDSTGVREARLTKSAFPGEYSKLRKGEAGSRQVWRREGQEITALDRKSVV